MAQRLAGVRKPPGVSCGQAGYESLDGERQTASVYRLLTARVEVGMARENHDVASLLPPCHNVSTFPCSRRLLADAQGPPSFVRVFSRCLFSTGEPTEKGLRWDACQIGRTPARPGQWR